jgi:hypothetical protein
VSLGRLAATAVVALVLAGCSPERGGDTGAGTITAESLTPETVARYLDAGVARTPPARAPPGRRPPPRVETCQGANRALSEHSARGGEATSQAPDADQPAPGELRPADAEREGYGGLDAGAATTVEFMSLEQFELDLPGTSESSESSASTVTVVIGGGSYSVDLGPCAEDALLTVFGSAEEGAWQLLVYNYAFSSTDENALASATEQLFPDWSRCMRSYGYDFEKPREAWLEASGNPAGGYAIAVADAQCREQTGLNRVIREQVLADAALLLGSDPAALEHVHRVAGVRE